MPSPSDRHGGRGEGAGAHLRDPGRQPARARLLHPVRRALVLGCLATIGMADYVIRRRRPRWIVAGLLDHPAHVATAILIRPAWTNAYLAGSLLPDLDHVPLALRRVHPSPGDPRPSTHCLAVVAPAAALSPALAAGMLAHYARDLAGGSGVPLLWPASARPLRLPYAVYLAACLLLAGRATLRDGL